MPDHFSRTRLIFGAEGMERLYRARVAVFGIGGVGGYTVEALGRSCAQRGQAPGSSAFVPGAAGLIIAAEVVKDLTGFRRRA